MAYEPQADDFLSRRHRLVLEHPPSGLGEHLPHERQIVLERLNQLSGLTCGEVLQRRQDVLDLIEGLGHHFD
jgi:hypothetical protein